MRLLSCGDTGLLVELDRLDDVVSLHAALRERPVPGVEDLVPAARTILLRTAGDPERVARAVRAAWEERRPAETAAPGKLLEIPVVYDGPDLREVGELTGLGSDGVVERHTARVTTVAFCGFAPGFGYLTGGDPRLFVPRRPSARTRVPAGAVALAGEFTGVYPRESPGGWRLIGRTSMRVFDPARDPPALLRPGVRVRFVEVAA